MPINMYCRKQVRLKALYYGTFQRSISSVNSTDIRSECRG